MIRGHRIMNRHGTLHFEAVGCMLPVCSGREMQSSAKMKTLVEKGKRK